MTDTEIKECQEWLDKLKLDDIPKHKGWQRSLMDITGVTHHENMWSDIYRFFFSINEEHNMKDLFIRSLEQILNIERPFLNDFNVAREYPADKQQRIDLLLKDDINHRAIIIENKVYHTLENDLDNYYDSVKKGFKDIVIKDSDIVVIVLGLTNYKLKDGYYSITHLDLLDKVLSNLPKYLPESNPKYIFLLQEFYKNIKNHTNMIDPKELAFFSNERNNEKIAKIHDIYRHIKDYLIMVMECKDSMSPLKDHIEKLGLNPVPQKTDKKEEYVKYVFKESNQIMLTVFYKNNILREKNPHIHIILEIQGNIKKKVESSIDKYIALRDSYKTEGVIPNETKRNEWWHFSSMVIPIDDLSKLAEIVSATINENCPLIKLGKAILND